MVMRMEADRMANLRITEKELIPERQVVLEERRMRIENSPGALLGEAVQEQLFGRHKPYGMPISGYVDDVKKLSVNDLTSFYVKWYAPNNAVLIVAGDTTADQVRKLAEKHYGPVAARKIEPRRRPSEGASDLPQKVTRADARVAEPRWSRDYLAPSYYKGETEHAYALQVLARLLGGGETSRLWKSLVVDRKLALSASAGYSPSSLGLTSFDLGVHPASNVSMAMIETAVSELLDKLVNDGVTADEVERAQNQLLAGAIYSQDSLQSGPRIYGSVLGVGGTIADIDAWPLRIGSVTPATVVAAARHVWRPDGLVTAVLTPQEGMR
jgi:zinc protease